jgi:CRP-like cAMP-binding protein
MTNPKKRLKSILDGTYQLSDKSRDLIMDILEYKTIPKNQVFIRRNNSNLSEYFILKGVCRSFLINPSGDETTISFFHGPTVLTPHIVRTVNGISLLNFAALTDLELAPFNAKAFLDLMIENVEVRHFANTVLQNELKQKVSKEIGLASQTAKERLIQFRKDFDGLENEVPHPMIASYLGITNISLSRLRRALANR